MDQCKSRHFLHYFSMRAQLKYLRRKIKMPQLDLLVKGLFLWKLLSVTNGVPTYEPVGCYLNSGISPQPLPRLLKDFRPEVNWNNIEVVIDLCAGLAHDEHFGYFGLQDYGQCWSGATADQTYNRDGSADNCIRGVGLASTYFVYKFYNYGDKVPGCGDGWRAQKNSCFKTTSDSNNSATEAMDYCLENGADLAMVPDVGSLRLVEQFLYSMKIDSALNTVQCVVLSAANASLDGSFQPSKKLTLKADENLGTKFTCAESGLDRKWYLHNCQSRSCDHLCISPREIIPVAGKLVQVAINVVITGHVIARLVVDDVTDCGRECLLYLNCLSFNFQYKPNGDYPNLGRICELNDEVRRKEESHMHQKTGYKYYERFNV